MSLETFATWMLLKKPSKARMGPGQNRRAVGPIERCRDFFTFLYLEMFNGISRDCSFCEMDLNMSMSPVCSQD